MPSISTAQIERSLKTLRVNQDDGTLIFDVLQAYGLPRSSVARLRSGALNLAKGAGDLLWRDKLFYHREKGGAIRSLLSSYLKDSSVMRQHPRFVVVSDGENWACCDTKTAETEFFPVAELVQHYAFFNPWAGLEKPGIVLENPADIKAARKMGKLVDALRRDNPGLAGHDMNVFMARLLFCFFAEDSGIFAGDNAFTNYIKANTLPDGSDLHEHIDRIFRLMNVPESAPARRSAPVHLRVFPYVNGGLFRDVHPVPKFSMKAREAIIEAGDLNWAEINTDIFGNMFQACLDPEQRANLGEHYTSVPNIMKVLNPLFLESLQAEAEKVKGKQKDAQRFIDRLSRIRFFDPACGSGNFLIVAFKEIRKLEMDVIENTEGLLHLPSVGIHQFYGIEIDDFAHEIAVLSLWLVDHQMNLEFNERFGTNVPTLPLKPNDHIYCGNALRMDWEKVCPKVKYATSNAAPEDEVYIFGNPPYLGGKKQSVEQKEDVEKLFSHYGHAYKGLDYVSCWFILAALYLKNTKNVAAFVSTNSITQGEQVPILWPALYENNMDINFAYTSFKWVNNAMYQAGVTCIIVAISDINYIRRRTLFVRDSKVDVDSISAYLTNNEKIIIHERNTVLSPDLPKIVVGSAPVDDGNLILSTEEKEKLVGEYPSSTKYIKRYVTAGDYLNGKVRFCLLLTNAMLAEARKVPEIVDRLSNVKKFRLSSPAASIRKQAVAPHVYVRMTYKPLDAIMIPRVSSERRTYIPCGYLSSYYVISEAFAAYGAEPWVFAVITSRMHVAWARVTCGKLKTDFRYSAKLCYNTFPLKPLTAAQKEALTEAAWGVLGVREYHTDMTMAQMYDPDTMPEDLLEAHRALDEVVDRLYRPEGFQDDEERLECLFKLYQEMA